MSDRLAAIDVRLRLLTWMVGVNQAMTPRRCCGGSPAMAERGGGMSRPSVRGAMDGDLDRLDRVRGAGFALPARGCCS